MLLENSNSGVLAVIFRTTKGIHSAFGFGMQMPGRNGGEDYRYAFNGMEHDPEVSGDGNSYTTEFRSYDPRLGRWKSLDPLMANFAGLSAYIGLGNNPVSLTDPSGLTPGGVGDGSTGTITATIYFQADAGEGTSLGEMMAYMDAFQANVQANWDNGKTYTLPDGSVVPVNTMGLSYVLLEPGETVSLGPSDNLLTVGNGASATPESVTNTISYIDRVGGNTGYMYLSRNGSDAGHEFGHLLGLQDRYAEGIGYNGDNSTIQRSTVPLVLPALAASSGYNYQNNLYAGTGAGLTNNQLGYVYNNNNERPFLKVGIMTELGSRSLMFDGVDVTGSKAKPSVNLYFNGALTVPNYTLWYQTNGGIWRLGKAARTRMTGGTFNGDPRRNYIRVNGLF
jgi:RHS repeat-associated protein